MTANPRFQVAEQRRCFDSPIAQHRQASADGVDTTAKPRARCLGQVGRAERTCRTVLGALASNGLRTIAILYGPTPQTMPQTRLGRGWTHSSASKWLEPVWWRSARPRRDGTASPALGIAILSINQALVHPSFVTGVAFRARPLECGLRGVEVPQTVVGWPTREGIPRVFSVVIDVLKLPDVKEARRPVVKAAFEPPDQARPARSGATRPITTHRRQWHGHQQAHQTR